MHLEESASMSTGRHKRYFSGRHRLTQQGAEWRRGGCSDSPSRPVEGRVAFVSVHSDFDFLQRLMEVFVSSGRTVRHGLRGLQRVRGPEGEQRTNCAEEESGRSRFHSRGRACQKTSQHQSHLCRYHGQAVLTLAKCPCYLSISSTTDVR